MEKWFVSRNDWWGDPNSPCNKTEPKYVDCEVCKGEGNVYCNEGGDMITKEEYEQLPTSEQVCWFLETCRDCQGVGVIKCEEYD